MPPGPPLDQPPGALPVDERWPRVGHWLAAGPGEHPVDLAVLGVPTFATSIGRSATYSTPAAVRRALYRFTTWCASRYVDLADLWPWDVGDVTEPDGADGAWRVARSVETACAKAKLLVVLGGDGSATAAAVHGGFDLQTAGVVAFDAQPDVRPGRTSASSLRDVMDAGLDGGRIAHVGAADWMASRSYLDEARACGMHLLPRPVVETRGVAACTQEALDVAGARGQVHVSFDLSVCDRAVAPACRDAVAGGLSAREVLAAAFAAGRDPRVRSIDLVEIDANADTSDQRTVRLAAMLLLEAAAGAALRPGR